MSKDKKICLLVPYNRSVSDKEDDNNSDYEIREDQDISEKEDTGKTDKDEGRQKG